MIDYRQILREFFWIYRSFINYKLANKSNVFWKSNKGIYKGKRGFVIGNGPSLNMGDLDKLKNEISIASNKIYLAFNQTDWRPTMLTVGDRLLWNQISKEIYNMTEQDVIVAHNRLPLQSNRTIIFKRNGFFKDDDKDGFSQDILVDGAWGGRTITYINIQISIHLGLSPIYLIGCDHYYKENKPEKNSTSNVIENQDNQNHFIKNYRKKGQKVNFAPIDLMTESYENARKICEKNNISIYNATRGGYLEVFKRVNFDNLF